MKKAKSSKQSGGITANNLKICGDYRAQPKSSQKLKRSHWKTSSIVITSIAGVIAILTYFGLTPNNMDQQPNPSQSAESNKQSGGITANEVTINVPANENEYDKFYVDVSSMKKQGDLYRRTVKVRNNTKYPQNTVHISINGTEEILHSGHPIDPTPRIKAS